MEHNITTLSNKVAEQQKRLKAIVDETINLDSVRLEKIIITAVAGLSFDKVWASKKTSIAGNDEITKTLYTYIENNGKKIRAIKVDEYKGEDYSKDVISEREDRYELLLTPNSFIKTHVYGESIQGAWGRVDLVRDVMSYDYDPLTTNENLEYEWNIENIIESICQCLEKRNKDLEDRIVKQEERLNKIKTLQID